MADIDISKTIPQEMQDMPHWVAFRTRTVRKLQSDGTEKDRLKKMLYDCHKYPYGKQDPWASSIDPATWTTFDGAREYARKYGLNGVAFALKNSGIACVDLDHHVSDDGKKSDLAEIYLAAAKNTYCEKSASGHGIHIFYKGAKPNNKCSKNDEINVECYDDSRFICITGNLIDGAKNVVSQPTEALLSLLNSNLKDRTPPRRTDLQSSCSVSDNEVIERIMRSKKQDVFVRMFYRGELTVNDNHSDTDLSLMNILSFYNGGDPYQAENMFRQSALYRPEKGDKYVKITAEKACSSLFSVYKPYTQYTPQTAKKVANNDKGGK